MPKCSRSWHKHKTAIYTALVADGAMPARPGIARIVEEAAAAGWQLAVASTSAEPSVRAVLEHAVGPERAEDFAVFAGDVVPAKKPDPASTGWRSTSLPYHRIRPSSWKTARNGLRAALGAGLACVVTVSTYTADEDFTGASLVVSSLGDPGEPATVLDGPAGHRTRPSRDAGRPRGRARAEQVGTAHGHRRTAPGQENR